jgi:hypothetical protein
MERLVRCLLQRELQAFFWTPLGNVHFPSSPISNDILKSAGGMAIVFSECRSRESSSRDLATI